jgi:adenine-specific DNA-methyltransferase
MSNRPATAVTTNAHAPAEKITVGSDVASRKLRGAYYTPPRLAGLLCNWVLALDPKRILEPSYGEGVFLREAEAKLLEKGVRDPGHRLHGVELEPTAATRLRESGLRLPEKHLRKADLLSLTPEHLGGRFDAIIGNPPYIRHHLLTPDLAARGREGAERLGIKLNGRSDAWAYFCAHLVGFLADGGRLALVLPGSVLQAEYAKPLLEALAREDGEVQLVALGERVFRGVQEQTVLLLLDRSKQSGKPLAQRRIATVSGLGQALERQPRARSHGTGIGGFSWRLSAREEAVWERICATEGVSRLGELAKIRIGVVTGANSFFVRTPAGVAELGKRVDSVPIVPRGAWLAEPRWNSQSQKARASEPSRLVVFPSAQSGLSRAARNAIKAGEQEELHLRHHCGNREPWYAQEDTKAPDIFLPYMGSEPPRLVLNETGATCTNAIHRVWRLTESEVDLNALVAASWTTLYRLSAELVGRSYGGGVLKLEPTRAMALRLALPPGSSLELKEIEHALDQGGAQEAVGLADERLLIEGLGISKKELTVLRTAAGRLRKQRKP